MISSYDTCTITLFGDCRVNDILYYEYTIALKDSFLSIFHNIIIPVQLVEE